MTGRNSIITVAVLLFFLFILFLSYNLVGRFTLSSYTLTSIPETYSVESTMLSSLGRNKLFVSEKRIRKILEGLPYIEKASVKLRGTELLVDGKTAGDGVIISDGRDWYFYSGTLQGISFKDVGALRNAYPVLCIESSLFSSIMTRSFSSAEKNMLDTLMTLKHSSNLITKAEYGNNEECGFPLSLTVSLEPLSSVLVVENITDAARIEEALSVIENEYSQSGLDREGERRMYVLSGSRLIETR